MTTPTFRQPPRWRRMLWPASILAVFSALPAQDAWEERGPSSRKTGLAFSEIHYHPVSRADGKNLEFIELYNSNPWAEDVGGYRLSGEADYVIPSGTEIAGLGYLVIAKVPADVESAYGITGVVGGFSQNLSNSGGQLRLRKPSGAIVLDVEWNDQHPWPVAADGTGHSMVLARPSYGENSPRAWAASPALGGSPGAGDTPPSSPLDAVSINELLARPGGTGEDFIELRNDGTAVADLSGCTLSDDPAALAKFVIPPGTSLAPGAFVVFTESQFGFGLASDGETVYFSAPDGARVLDCVRFKGSASGVSLGRAFDKKSEIRALASPTPGAANAGLRTPELLISELYFDPITDDDADEWLELHNPGSEPVDASGWNFVDGITFSIPGNTVVAPGGWLVVAKNRARTLANHPSLAPSAVVGDYSGTLSNNGERITLTRAEISDTTVVDVVVDTLIYQPESRWSRWAAGGGSSLEAVDLRADRALPSTWADSDETGKAPWTTVSVTGPLDLPHSAVTSSNRLQLFLADAGEALVDNVEVTPEGGENRITNGGFESGMGAWRVQGNQSRSALAAGLGVDGSAALHVRASNGGDPDGNRIYVPFTPALAANSRATVSAQVRWLCGDPQFILRLRGGHLETLAKLNVPKNLGTPGAANSRRVPNAGPAIMDVAHRPLLPAANESIYVSARLSDPDGIGVATLQWRRQNNTLFTSAAMLDDGQNGDAVAGDGIFTGVIPGQPTGTLVVFRVMAQDAQAIPSASMFPPDAPARECLVRVGEREQAGAFFAYRMWLTPQNVSAWSTRAKFGNEPIDVTFIYGKSRALYGCGAWYGGSEASTPGFNSPVSGTPCAYNVALPFGEGLLGVDELDLDHPVRDSTDQREQLMYWMAEQLGLPNLYRRYIHFYVNGTRRTSAGGTNTYNDVQRPKQAVVDQYFPDDRDGQLYKTNNWNEGADDANSTSAGEPNRLQLYLSGGQPKLARYRWTWRPRASRDANNFAPLLELIGAANASAANLETEMSAVADMENWMRTFAFHDICSYWDAFGNPNHKNTYLYKPRMGRWVQFTWDMDVGLGVFNDPVDAALFPATVDTRLDAIQARPGFRRLYWQAIHQALNSFFSGDAVTPLLQRKYATFQPNGLTLVSPFVASGAYGKSIPQWIDDRRAFLQTQLNTVAATFAMTSPAETTTPTPSVALTGRAPVNVKTILVNGAVLPVTWTAVTTWRISVTPLPGSHPYVIRALDYNGVEVGTATITINYTGATTWPALKINEWMASNSTGPIDPDDGGADDWLELFNPTAAAVTLAGWRLSDSNSSPTEFIFPSGYSIAANGYVLAWCDEATALNNPPASLHLPFRLSASGETLTLTAPDGTVVDTVTFGEQTTDVSQGRSPDGGDAIVVLPAASPGASNAPAPPAVPLEVLSLIQAGGNYVLIVATEPGKRYQLQSKTSLDETAWANEGPAVLAEASTVAFTITAGAEPQRFFRVQRQGQ